MIRPMRNRRVSTGIAAICALALVPSVPIRAAEDTKDDEPSKTDKLLTQVTALTAAIEGFRDKGGDTVKDKGGELEGALLSSFAIRSAAEQIRAENTGTGYLVASPSDAVATDLWLLFDAQRRGLCVRLTRTDTCGTAAAAGSFYESEQAGAVPLIPLATAVLPFLSSLLRSETEVSALGGEFSDSKLLARAVANDGTETSKFELLVPPRLADIASSEPYTALQTLIVARNSVATANAKKKKPDAAVAASVKAADDFVASILTADAAGKVPLLDVIRAKTMLANLGKHPLLTVSIERAGGTMLKRKGIDVALGAPSVRASGGVIISYTVTNTAGSEITKTGFLACTTRLTELKRIHTLNTADRKGKCT